MSEHPEHSTSRDELVAQLAAALPEWLPTQRWFGGKDREIDAVELATEFDQRFVAARLYVGNNRPHRQLDVGIGLALGVEKRAETLGKIRIAGVEADRHGLS